MTPHAVQSSTFNDANRRPPLTSAGTRLDEVDPVPRLPPPVPPAVPGSVSGNRTGDELVRRDRSELVSSRHRDRDCRVRGVPDAQLPTLIVAPAPRRPIGADRAHRRAQPACGRARRQPGETTRSERAPPSRGEPPKAANDLSGRASYMRGSRRGGIAFDPPPFRLRASLPVSARLRPAYLRQTW